MTNGSYAQKFQDAFLDGLFSDEDLAIADNIQNIYNTLNSEFPDDPLIATTELVEADEIIPEHPTENNFEELLASIGELFGSQANSENLKSESEEFNPSLSGSEKLRETITNSSIRTEVVLEDVISDPEEQEKKRQQKTKTSYGRFQANVSTLNSLVMKRIYTEEGNTGGNGVDATGTWESIEAWAVSAKLDLEQHTAFEILAATYVLTFFEEAKPDGLGDAEYCEQLKYLRMIARRKTDSKKPLRMFVTGPAGAGKSMKTKSCLIVCDLYV